MKQKQKNMIIQSFRNLMQSVTDFFQSAAYIFATSWKVSKGYMVFRFLLMAVGALFPVALLYIDKHILDQINQGSKVPLSALLILLATLAVIKWLDQLSQTITSAAMRIFNMKIQNKLQETLFSKSAHIQLKSFDTPYMQDKLFNAHRLTGQDADKYLTYVIQLTTLIIRIAGVVVILSASYPLLMMLAVISVIPQGILNVYNARKLQDHERAYKRVQRKMNYYHSTLVQPAHAKEIRVFGIGDYILENRNKHYSDYASSLLEMLGKRQVKDQAANIFRIIFQTCIPLYLLAISVMHNGSSIGQFTLLFGNVTLLSEAIASIFNDVGWATASTQRFRDYQAFLKLPLDPREGLPIPAEWYENPPEIVFEHVYYRYAGKNEDVLKDVSFTIGSRQKIAIIGLNGAGKTTIIKLLTGLYEPTQGSITLNGIDIKSFRQEDIYKMFSVVFQDFIDEYLVSLRLSLSLGREGLENNDEALVDAMKQTGIDYILKEKCIYGLDTMMCHQVDEKAISLSGGEKQKFALARAILQNRSFFVLDEPTSSLDPFAEAQVLEHFITLKKNHTCVVVSHRLSCGTLVDKVILVKEGTVHEQGTHEELLEQNGDYASLFRLQAEKYAM